MSAEPSWPEAGTRQANLATAGPGHLASLPGAASTATIYTDTAKLNTYLL